MIKTLLNDLTEEIKILEINYYQNNILLENANEQLKIVETLLNDLLEGLYADNRQYVSKHGTEKATKDAIIDFCK